MNAVGIDVSKKKSTVTIRQPGDVVLLPPKDYRHTQSSINDLVATIKGLDGETKVCMEHTSRYYEPMASWLSAAGIFVCAVNPKLIKDFGNESLRAPKTDKADSKKIARRSCVEIHLPNAICSCVICTNRCGESRVLS